MRSQLIKFFPVFAVVLSLFYGHRSFADHASGPVTFKVIKIMNKSGEVINQVQEGDEVQIQLKIMSTVAEGPYSNKVLTPDDLLERHEKMFHFFAFDQGLSNFIHEHPVYQNDYTWIVKTRFNKPGTYRLWANVVLNQTAPAVGDPQLGYECAGYTLLTVTGKSPQSPTLASVSEKLEGSDNQSTLSIDVKELHADQPTMIPVKFSRNDGTQASVTDYLGAKAHFVITNPAGNKIYHFHPMESCGQTLVHATLPSGSYRVFGQYMDGGVLRTVELGLNVN